MFDIGFSEIVLIAVVALIVIGPEKLPKTARTLGHLFGRLQRYVSDVKADINREMELDELRKLRTEVQSAARDIESSFDSATREMEAGVSEASRRISPARRPGRRPRAGAGASALPELSTSPETPAAPARGSSRPGLRTGSPGVAARFRARLTRAARLHVRSLARARDPAGKLHLAPGRAAHAAIRSMLAILIALLALFPWAKDIYALLAAPLLQVLPAGATMIATDVTGTFLVPLKVTLMAAFLIALPFVL